MTDDAEPLNVPSDAMIRLANLRAEPKFHADPGRFYTGIHDQEERENAERALNELISNIENGLHQQPTRQFVLGQFAACLD
jgi:hypothetical protein